MMCFHLPLPENDQRLIAVIPTFGMPPVTNLILGGGYASLYAGSKAIASNEL